MTRDKARIQAHAVISNFIDKTQNTDDYFADTTKSIMAQYLSQLSDMLERTPEGTSYYPSEVIGMHINSLTQCIQDL